MRSSWVKLGRRYDPDQYWAGQHLKVTLSHNAEQATEEQGRGGREEKQKTEVKILSGKIRTTRTPEEKNRSVALFDAVKQTSFDSTRHKKGLPFLLKCPKNTQPGTEQKQRKSFITARPSGKTLQLSFQRSTLQKGFGPRTTHTQVPLRAERAIRF